MKKLLASIALLMTAVATLPVHSAQSTGNFDVLINLTSACKYVKTTDVQFSYTSFQTLAASQTTSGAFTVQCTKNLPYTLALDTGPYTDSAVDLTYTLALSAASGTGNGTAQGFSVTGSMAGGQAGACATAGGACTNALSTNKQRTLTITY